MTFTIIVTNTGGEALRNVEAIDARDRGYDRKLGTFEPGEVKTTSTSTARFITG